MTTSQEARNVPNDDQFGAVVNDRRFQGLSPAEQRQVLYGITNDTRFQSMSDADTLRFVSTVKSPPPAPTAGTGTQQGGGYMGDLLSKATSINAPDRSFAGQLNEQLGKIRGLFGADKMIGGGTNELLAGPIIGPVQALHGLVQMPSHPVRGTNEIVKGIGEAGALPSAVFNPATIGISAPGAVVQHGVQKGLENLGADKDWAELGGNIAGIGTGVKIIKGLQPKVLISNTEAASKIRDAVNPPPKNAPNFEKNVAKNLDVARDAAKRSGFEIHDRPTLAEAFKTAGDETRATYYDKMLGPVKDVEVPVTGARGYGGTYDGAISPSSNPNALTAVAKLSQLDARLSEINAQLRSAYEKGGKAAQAAVKSKGDLTAEAAWIRSTLDNEIGQRIGIDPEVVANTRARFGQLSDLADKVTQSMSKSRYAANAAKQGEQLPHSVSELGIRFANRATRWALGHPADRAIEKTIQKLQ
jgi:hypothetical protein